MNSTTETAPASAVLRERKLAAVVFTDVVGYSAMVQADEAASIERVRADLARMREACAAHEGDFLNAMGDGLMLSFDSAVQAVAFATEVQEAFASRNDAAADREKVQHRIGIHVGDVFRTTDGLVAGDGVNIAARLQTDAPAGGVCVSQAVRDLVRGKADFDARFAGSRAFKNIAEPLAVWHWHPRESGKHATRSGQGRLPRRTLVLAGVGGAAAIGAASLFVLRDKLGFAAAPAGPKSLAVLPFQNLSDDKDAAYFADGIQEDLLTQLALLGDLKVVSRTSVMEYRNTTKKVPQIGSELKVGALVEGSVRKAGNTVRVTAQLVDAQADKHIWAANYDRDLKDVFKVQNELAKEIASSLNVSLTAAEEQRLSRAPTQNLQAYEYYLKHQQVARDAAGTYRAISSVNERVELLEKAVALDPGFGLAWARLGAERARSRGFFIAADRDEQARLARQAIAKAKQLAPDDLQVKIEDAVVHLHGLDDQPGAVRLYNEVLAAAPYNIDALSGLAEVMGQLNRTREEVDLLEKALTVDARHGTSITRLANAYGQFRHFDRALELRQKLVDMRSDDLDRQAGFQYWMFFKTGRWDAYDRWRPSLPAGVENKVARVRNLDADRAIERGDFAELHRLTDVDSTDWKFDLAHRAHVEAQLLALHAVIWRAQGDPARAARTARQALAQFERAIREDKDGDSWLQVAEMHALLGDRAAADSAYAKDLELRRASGNQWQLAGSLHSRLLLDALLGEEETAVKAFKEGCRRPGFLVHSERHQLELALLWKRSDFQAIVSDPQSNAPLPLDTPVIEPPR